MKMERLIGILSILLQRERVTAPELAEQFEVSRRTIQRDIESLCRAGIPITTAQGTGGGISIMEGYRVDWTVLTAPEMQAILAGLRSLDSVSGTRRYAQLMEKLSAGTGALVPGGAHMLIDLSSWYKTSLPPKIELIQSAIEQHRAIRFTYFSPKGESVRTVEPCYLVFHWSAWYVWGWCRSREDFRPGLRPCRSWSRIGSFRRSIRSPCSLTPAAAGGWGRNTGRTASLRSRTVGCALPEAFPTRTASSAGCSPLGIRRNWWSRRNCGSSWDSWPKHCPIVTGGIEMASHQYFVDYVAEQLREAGTIRSRKMFGEYGLYCDGVFFAVICDDQFFVKVTPAGEVAFPSLPKAPPYEGSRDYIWVEDVDDRDTMTALTRLTCLALQAQPKKGRK